MGRLTHSKSVRSQPDLILLGARTNPTLPFWQPEESIRGVEIARTKPPKVSNA